MPKIGQPPRRDYKLEAALAELEAFEDLSAWRLSQKGNLCRDWNDLTVSLFYKNHRYHWSMARDDDVEYSEETYGDLKEAMAGLGKALGVGEP
jgi:hypothetical protein